MPTVQHSFFTSVDALALHLGCTHNKALEVLDHERGLLLAQGAHSLTDYLAMDRTEERLVLNPVGRRLVYAALVLELVSKS